MQTRRKFIKKSCSGCFGVFALGLGMSSVISSCGTAINIYKVNQDSNQLKIPIASFTPGQKMIIVRSAELQYDILLLKLDNADYRAIYMRCTHRDNPLTVNDKGMYCSEHGSAFDLQGNVTREPALQPLKKFKTAVDSENILIFIG